MYFLKNYWQNYVKPKNEGFTLIELLVVVIIIGILASIALPNLFSQAAKSRQSEAEMNLGVINRAQQVHRLEFGTFGNVGHYVESYNASTNTSVVDVFYPPVANGLPISLQLKFYEIRDSLNGQSPGNTSDALATQASAIVIAEAVTQYENDILDYTAHVTRSTTGSFASIICQETVINFGAFGPPGTTVNGAGLVDGCANSGLEIK